MSSSSNRGSRGRRGSRRGRGHGGGSASSGPNEGDATDTNAGMGRGDGGLVTSGSGPDLDLGGLVTLVNRRPGDRFTLRLKAVPKGAKRSSTDAGPAAKKKKTRREVPAIPERATCGNCGADGHRAAFRVRIGRSGWVEACPKCDSTEHLYEARPHRVKGPEDFQYLIFNRQRKPPVKTKMDRAASSLRGKYEIKLPYSSKYARLARDTTSPPNKCKASLVTSLVADQ